MNAPKEKKTTSSAGFGGNTFMSRDNKEDNTKKAMLVTVIGVVVLLLVSLFINSAFIRQHFTAVSVDSVKYSVTDFNYYYENIYLQYYNAMSSSSGMSTLLPDSKKSLKSQIYDDKTGETWDAFFKQTAIDQMKEDAKVYIEAQKANYQLTDADKSKIDDSIKTLKSSITSAGYTSLSDYLKAAYGKGMTEATYRKNLEKTTLVQSYTQHVNDSFTYTSDQLETYYQSKKDTYDTYTYRYFLVSAADVKQTDYKTDDEYQKAKTDAVNDTVTKAQAYAAKITDVNSFIAAAKDYDAEQYGTDSSTERTYQGSLLGSDYGPWLEDASRKAGDVTTAKTTSGCYVVMYESRSDNHYTTANIQYLLVNQTAVDKTKFNSDTNSDAYKSAVAAAKKNAEDQANKIYSEWISKGPTADNLKSEYNWYKDVTGMSLENKEEDNVYKTEMAAAVNDWLFDGTRKAGDYTLAYDESKGFYIVLYTGTGKQYSDVLADTGKRADDLKAWEGGLKVGEPQKSWFMILTK